MAHILIAEAEAAVRELIVCSLSLVGHDCRELHSGLETREALCGGGVDLALVDVMLPDMSGLELLRTRPDPSVPVLLLAERSNLADRKRALELGADGYLIKPCEIMELVARVTEALRRAQREEKCFEIDGVSINFDTRTAFLGGEAVELTPQEFSLLETLIIHRNLAMSREKLLKCAWGFDYAGATRTVDVHIQKLRKKLRFEERIKTVYKLGYRFETQ